MQSSLIGIYGKYFILLFIVSRIIFTGIADISQNLINHYHRNEDRIGFVYPGSKITAPWINWDSHIYLSISMRGYVDPRSTLPPADKNTLGFLPLYPLLIWLIKITLLNDYAIAGIIISNACLLGSLYIAKKLFELDFDQKTTSLALIFLLCFPSAFILSGVLTESLFLLLSLLSFYFIKKNSWWYASWCISLLSITKIFGLLLAPLTLVIFIKKYGWSKFIKSPWWTLPIPLSILCFFIYSKQISGSYFAYFNIQNTIWSHSLSNPFSVILNSIGSLHWYEVASGLWIILCGSLIVWSWKKIPFEYSVWGLLLLIANPLSGTVVGSIRYSSIIFTIPLCLSCIAINNENLRKPLLVLSVGLQILLFILWTNAFWIMS